MQTSDLNVNNTESDHANAFFRQFQDAIFSREHTYVKTLTKIIFDLLQWQEIATLSLPKKSCHRFFHLNSISRVVSPRSQWDYPKSITCHFLQSMRRHFSPVKAKVCEVSSRRRNHDAISRNPSLPGDKVESKSNFALQESHV